MAYLALAARCLIGIVFLVSAVSKTSSVRAFREFTESLDDMPLVPPVGKKSVALSVILAEYSVPLLMPWPETAVQAAGFLVSAGLLGVFALSIAVAVRRGKTTPCRCFGTSATPLGARHLVRNLVLAALAGLGVALVLGPASDAPAHPGGAVIAAAGGAALAALVATLDDIVQLFRPAPGRPGPRPGPPRRHPSQEETPHAVPDRGPAARGGAVRPGSRPHPGSGQAAA
ncbi:hypothetical protein SLA_0510 [Streptomyces laurentii]|uniref:Methylamine utilisation protein MauE domain-containing protein n=1 Tax=Streptomyces laurentii TaxID=39478 RepID=A0A160NUG9_STRLU|nr:hypothetical protein SLA_0510 [Streptomyces laurentii]